MPRNEKLTLSAIAANIIDVIEDEMQINCDNFNLEEKIEKELKPLIRPTDYGFETDEIVE